MSTIPSGRLFEETVEALAATRFLLDVERAKEARRVADEHGGNILWWVDASEDERQAAGITAPIYTAIQSESGESEE